MLRHYWNEVRLSASQIASIFHCTRNAVIGKARRLGLDARTTANRPAANDLRKHRRPRPRMPRILAVLPPIDDVPNSAPIVPPTRELNPRQSVALVDLQPQHCRWMVGEPTDFLFCGRHKFKNSSYCLEHTRKSRQGGR